MDGKKYNDCKATYALMRQTSDQLCLEHGLSVIESPEQGRTMSRDTWEAEQKGRPTWYGQIRQDVDSCITRSFLFEHFIVNLKKQGYGPCSPSGRHSLSACGFSRSRHIAHASPPDWDLPYRDKPCHWW